MSNRKQLTEQLTDFKSARDALVHADDGELLHQAKLFVRQLDSNPLCQAIVNSLPLFDANAWWRKLLPESRQRNYLEALDLPESRDDQLSFYLDLVRSFASEDPQQMSPTGFGMVFGNHKRSDAYSVVRSMVFRPMAEELTRRVRENAMLNNPDVRDLAGVPLERLPSDEEVGIFLSHKSINKDIVRRYHAALQLLGFKPWLDEKDIVAGDVLHRVLAEGMDSSCAAVFFVTADFHDEKWLGQEVDLAIARKVELGNKFQIITLVFEEATVPRPLQRYVYATVSNDLDGLKEIVKALPLELGPPRWRERALKKSS